MNIDPLTTNTLPGRKARKPRGMIEMPPLLTTVYTRAGGELTDPQEGCKLTDIKYKSILRRTAMRRRSDSANNTQSSHRGEEGAGNCSGVEHFTHDGPQVSQAPGSSDPETASTSALTPLDPFQEQIKKWVMEDHCTNCEVLFERLQKLGYTGGISILKEYVHPLQPAVAGHAPIQRYETKPGQPGPIRLGRICLRARGQNA
jgi:hypothetical protein